MNTLGRRTLLLMIPVNLVLIVWVWFGRVVFGVGGWFFLIFMLSVVPVLLIALLVTTILAFTQPGRPRSLTGSQAVTQVVVWVAMFVFGAFMPDFGDTDDSHISLLTQVFGPSDAALSASYTIAFGAAAVVLVSYLVLLVMLIADRRKQERPPPPRVTTAPV
ncbi:hypothetical protein H5V45_01625 [Nocardioides sp. KIGAM211]|uniref:Uncharacterized protein n=1 Tax=Nocardioides luti TaxID=2761101 RepID=A0A7X0VAE2_9ACTN|nr:hypothetical protein [Nocardioides luti]MBB6626008.1 hypothetical protein [Nocardioides luti]